MFCVLKNNLKNYHNFSVSQSNFSSFFTSLNFLFLFYYFLSQVTKKFASLFSFLAEKPGMKRGKRNSCNSTFQFYYLRTNNKKFFSMCTNSSSNSSAVAR
jgi:hypothetical protein